LQSLSQQGIAHDVAGGGALDKTEKTKKKCLRVENQKKERDFDAVAIPDFCYCASNNSSLSSTEPITQD